MDSCQRLFSSWVWECDSAVAVRGFIIFIELREGDVILKVPCLELHDGTMKFAVI